MHLVILLLLLAAPSALLAHGALKSSDPKRDARLEQLPSRLRLAFTERVELAVARLYLVRDGRDTIALSPLTADSGGHVIVAGIIGNGMAGAYTIHWQVSGRDGHPVRGTIPFTVSGNPMAVSDSVTRGTVATDTASQGTTADSGTVAGNAFGAAADAGSVAGGMFASNGMLQTAVRWLSFLAMFGIVGAAATWLVPVRSLSRHGRGAYADTLAARCRTTCIGSLILLLSVNGIRLLLQHHALNDGGAAVSFPAILTSTTWGTAWLLQLAGIVVALLAALGLQRIPRAKHALLALLLIVGCVAIAAGFASSGHAAAAENPMLAVLYDSTHMLGAATWIGMLGMLLVSALPRLRSDAETAFIALRAFSRVAIVAVAVIATTGLLSAWTHVGAWQALTSTRYGQVLLIKLAVVLVVVLLGARNQRRVQRGTASGNGVDAVLRDGRAELVLTLVVLLVTAVLVATPTPPSALH